MSAPVRTRLIAALLSLLTAAGCAPSGGIRITPVPADQTLEEREVIRESPWTRDKIAIVDIQGVIANEPPRTLLGGSDDNPVSLITEKLEAARRDPHVRGVVLRINSPGGTVTASDIVHQEITRFRRETNRPVVAMIMDTGASGAYYAACAADEIMAERTSITGSIGVLMQSFSLAGAMAMVGVKSEAIKSGDMKDAGSPFRDLRTEERTCFQEMINDLHRRFVDVVVAGRPRLSRDRIVTLADGRVYTATQAVENGLVDRIGTLREAIDAAKRRAGITKANTIIYSRPLGWKGSAYAETGPQPTGTLNLSLVQINGAWPLNTAPRFSYLWCLE